MPHFFIEKENILNDILTVSDRETVCHLIQSLRVRPGDDLKFIDFYETVYGCIVETVSKNEIKAKIIEQKKSERKLDFSLCAAICVLKPDAMGLAIQNAVQLGAKEIFTVYSDNSTVKKKSVLNKARKWEKLALEAFKQCERADIPRVYEMAPFEKIFSKFKKKNILVFAEKYEEFTLSKALSGVDKNEGILAVFGPEGGFSENEFEYFKAKGLKLVTLGKLVLKAPNAVTAGLYGVMQNV